ncbi:helix-turn-helix transcriptional regulator [Natronorarus salvus]|uniref:helix-turn-helix transcriptional regulator n=1 Tax=Natronorarus salvus TaxID=3117733 RepID=UPI002F263175
MDATLDDIAFLVRSKHRVRVLETLHEHSRDRRELRAATGASSPTIGRVLTDLEDRHWIEREDATYELTTLGEFVADRFAAFSEAMTVERRIREVWPWLPHGIDGFGVEMFTDVVLSRPGPGYPYEPVERLAGLLEGTTTMRGFGMAMLKSGNLESFFDRALDDLECEYVYPPAVFEGLLSWDEETVVEAATRDNYTVLLHDDLPMDDRCGICLFDDRVSLCCYDHESGALRSLVDTGSTELYRWAESQYGRYRAEARPLETAADLLSVESVP